ncbi:MAG: hypothetical protein LKI18_00030 [Prevotella sp.]|nr:hypothetical protein [Prevotella sp.]
MTESEIQKYCRFLSEQEHKRDKQMNMIKSSLDEIREELKHFHVENESVHNEDGQNSSQTLKEIPELGDWFKEIQEKVKSLKRMNKTLSDCLALFDKDHKHLP